MGFDFVVEQGISVPRLERVSSHGDLVGSPLCVALLGLKHGECVTVTGSSRRQVLRYVSAAVGVDGGRYVVANLGVFSQRVWRIS